MLLKLYQAALLPSVFDGIYCAYQGVCLDLAAILPSGFNIIYQGSLGKKPKAEMMASE